MLYHAELTVTLTEGMQSILIEDPPRSISLVPGHNYTIECEGEWFQDGSPVTDDTSDPVHVTMDGASHELHLQPFGEQLEGEYVCESGGDSAALNITAGTCHNVIYTGRERPSGLDVKQSPDAQYEHGITVYILHVNIKCANTPPPSPPPPPPPPPPSPPPPFHSTPLGLVPTTSLAQPQSVAHLPCLTGMAPLWPPCLSWASLSCVPQIHLSTIVCPVCALCVPWCPVCAVVPCVCRGALCVPWCPVCAVVPCVCRGALCVPWCPVCAVVPCVCHGALCAMVLGIPEWPCAVVGEWE